MNILLLNLALLAEPAIRPTPAPIDGSRLPGGANYGKPQELKADAKGNLWWQWVDDTGRKHRSRGKLLEVSRGKAIVELVDGSTVRISPVRLHPDNRRWLLSEIERRKAKAEAP